MYIFTPNTLIESAKINANFSELKTKTDYLSAPDTGWHEVGGAGEPAYTNNWVRFAAGYANAGFFKDAEGIVHLRGMIKSGTVGASAFTLPVGYRPLLPKIVCTPTYNFVYGNIEIQANGNIYVANPCSNSWVSLDGINFKAEA